MNLAPKLNIALEELSRNNLIRWDHRIMAVHRVVQEAMNWNSRDELQSSFDSCVRLVYEGIQAQVYPIRQRFTHTILAFPKQVQANTMYDEWEVCQSYITHAVHLSKRYLEYQGPNKQGDLDPTPELIELLSNATWFVISVFVTGKLPLQNPLCKLARSKHICVAREYLC